MKKSSSRFRRNPRQDHSPPGHQRNGVTMIHMLVVLGVSGVLTGIASFWIHQSLRFSASVRQRQQQHGNLTRLAQQFRSDVWSSAAMGMDGKDTLLLTGSNGAETRYCLSPGSVTVERKRGSEVLSRDRFVLALHSSAAWDGGQLPDRIGLVVERLVPGDDRNQPASIDGHASQGAAAIELHVQASPRRWPSSSLGK